MPEENAIKVTVKLFASFRRDRFREALQSRPQGTRIADVVSDLGIEPTDVGMIFVRGLHAQPEQMLRDGDTLALFPRLGGG
ncbi:MoaD/ThiS family protein [Telmatospirillum sp.]|uniref:MoaD/ThiS family protein n=1 Tax=Telmatospirillum sp. TaxID=2079197 RepID=UPI00284EE474|nr:MoaD/ThiS family protein [Telmatospirillum sp.]MDR3439810.1 MoaD/ThiS family protein [Telmatospirillum sp.]